MKISFFTFLLQAILFLMPEFSSAQPTVLGTQLVNGGYQTYDLNDLGSFRQRRIAAISSGTGRIWEFASGTSAVPDYSINWRPYTSAQQIPAYNAYIDPSVYSGSARYNTSSGGSSGVLLNVTAGRYYTFNVSENPGSNNVMAVLETNYFPRNIITQTRTPLTPVNGSGVTVSATLNAVPNVNERVYVRYSNDGFVSSSLIQLTFNGGATGFASIPALTGTVQYYFLSAPSVATPSHATADMMTLNLLNNGGANYAYTYSGSFAQYERNMFSATYSAITIAGGATALAGGTAVTDLSTNTGVSNTQDGAALIPLPFNFNFGGTSYSVGTSFLNICTNGFLSFTSTNAHSAKITSPDNEQLHLNGIPNQVIAGWWDDLDLGTGELLYQTRGTAPSRTFTVQFGNYLTGPSSTSTLNFQIVLYESSHIIEFRYGAVTQATHFAGEGASVGLEWGSGGAGNMLDAITGSDSIGLSTNHTYQFPSKNYRFFMITGSPSPLPGGTYQVGSGYAFATISEFLSELNHRGIDGPVTMQLTDAAYSVSSGNIFPFILGEIAGMNASNTLTIEGNNAVIESAGLSGGSIYTGGSTYAFSSTQDQAVWYLAGSDNVRLSNLIIQHPASFATGISKPNRGFLITNLTSSNGAHHNYLQHVTVSLDRTLAQFPTGIYQRSNPSAAITHPMGANHYNIYEDIVIENVQAGIYIQGNSTYFDSSTVIRRSSSGVSYIGSTTAGDIGGATATSAFGIRLDYQSDFTISGIEVRNVSNGASTGTVDGIYVNWGAGTGIIHKNTVHGISSAAATYSSNKVSGIRFSYKESGVNEIRVFNNVIYGLSSSYSGAASSTRQIRGIYSDGIGGNTNQSVKVDFNSVLIDGSASPGISSVCFEIATTSGSLNFLRNNILVNATMNQSGFASHYAVYTPAAGSIGPAGSLWNRNIYFIPNVVNGYLAMANLTPISNLAFWQATMASSQDMNSYNTNPGFISSSDLHISNTTVSDAESSASYFTNSINWCFTDADGVIRDSTLPDIGAYEFGGCNSRYSRWIGAISSDWTVSGNWCGGITPGFMSVVQIPGATPYSPVINSGTIQITSLRLLEGVLTLNAGSTLQLLTGSITNNGGMLLHTGPTTVRFSGAGSINGYSPVSFRKLLLQGNLTINRSPEIVDELEIQSGIVSGNSLNYANSTTRLIYSTNSAYSAGAEWAVATSSGTGVPGTVQIGGTFGTVLTLNTTTFRQITGDLILNSSSGLTLAGSQELRISGSWTNQGGGFAHGNQKVIFNGPNPASISGTSVTNFGLLEVDKGSDTTSVLNVDQSITLNTIGTTQILNGLLRIRNNQSITKSVAAGWTIASTGGIDVDSGVLTQMNAGVTLSGLFRVGSGGTAHIGTAGSYGISYESNSVIHILGTLNIGARISPNYLGAIVRYYQSSGTATLNMSGSSSTSYAVFDLSASGSTFQMDGGTVVITRPCSFNDDVFIRASNGSVTGGTFQFCNIASPNYTVYRINSSRALFGIIMATNTFPVLQLNNSLIVNGPFTMGIGMRCRLNGHQLDLNGAITFGNALFESTAASVLKIGGSGAISGNLSFDATADQIGYFEMNRSGVPVTLASDLWVTQNGSIIAAGAELITLGNLELGTGPFCGLTINGTLSVYARLILNTGGFINAGHGPVYYTSSTLVYNTGGTFYRNVEWGSNTPGTEGYPNDVIIQNGTIVVFSNTTTFDVGLWGDLQIANPTGAGYGILDLSQMGIHDLYVNGSITIGGATAAGTLIMSNTVGGDLYLTRYWTRNSTGTVQFGAGNGRAVFLQGTFNTGITASGGQNFPYLYLNKNDKLNRLILNDHISITHEIGLNRGTVDLATSNKNLILLSSPPVTARVAPSDSSNVVFNYGASGHLGQVIIQRIIPPKRAWRLITAPIKAGGGTHTISQAWQERATPLLGLDYSNTSATTASISADSISAGYGTLITGGSAANGFDQSPTNNSGIKYFNGSNWTTPGSINNTSVNSQEGWMLFVRGDRKNYGEITNAFKAPTPTILRPRGQLYIGRKSISATGLTVVGNPYAASIDYTLVDKAGSGLAGTPTYYMWDPYLGGDFGVGAFVALTWNGTNFTRSAPLTGSGSSTIDNRYIPSGAAILVDFGTGGTLTFEESDKVTSATASAFRINRQATISLLGETAGGNTELLDGVTTLLDNQFSTQIDREDVPKLTNFSEMLSVQSMQQRLCIERRPEYQAGDTVHLYLQQLKARTYQLSCNWKDAGLPDDLIPVLTDRFLNAEQYQGTSHEYIWKFEASNQAPGSYANDRFFIVFKKKIQVTQLNILPLPCSTEFEWAFSATGELLRWYIQRRASSDESWNSCASGTTNSATSIKQSIPSPTPGNWEYRIQWIQASGDTACSAIKQVVQSTSCSGYELFPNPVASNQAQVIIRNQPPGAYQIELLDQSGKILVKRWIHHAGGTLTYPIFNANQIVPNGLYACRVSSSGLRSVTLKLIINQ